MIKNELKKKINRKYNEQQQQQQQNYFHRVYLSFLKFYTTKQQQKSIYILFLFIECLQKVLLQEKRQSKIYVHFEEKNKIQNSNLFC